MNLSFNYPPITPDPSYSFAPPGTRLPALTDAAYDGAVRRMLSGASEGLPEQEERVYRSEGNIRNFGHEFLLPPGRRQTQAETDQAGSRSPTPSDGHPAEARQEDNLGDQSEVPVDGGEEEEEDAEEERDLDEDMEDRDRSYGSGDGE